MITPAPRVSAGARACLPAAAQGRYLLRPASPPPHAAPPAMRLCP